MSRATSRKGFGCTFFIVLLLLGLFPLIFAIKWTLELPDYTELESLKLASSTTVLDRNGVPLGNLPVVLPNGAMVNRDLVTMQNVSKHLPMAVVTSEDRRFYEHYGLDVMGLARSLYKAVSGNRLEGGSTITQQVMKNTLLSDLQGARTLERKFKEWVLAVQIERYFSKDEILSLYLNVIYWGNGGSTDIIGADMAARAYFDTSPENLTLAQSVYLATLIPSPGRYFDYSGYRNLMKNILGHMVEDGRITQAEADRAWREKIQPAGWQVRYDAEGNITRATLLNRNAKHLPPARLYAPHYMVQLQKQLLEAVGKDAIYKQAGLKVYATLDKTAQDAIERASLNAQIPQDATLGAVILDPHTGDVRAMVGQKLYAGRNTAEWNNAVQAKRQVGSSIKPLLYATAISQGYEQDHRELDSPVRYGTYAPKNFSGTASGREMTLREALDKSLNLPTVRLADRIGVDTFASKLNEMDLQPEGNVGLSLALGALETSPLKMALSYSPFVSGGTYYPANYLLRVEQNGKALWDARMDRASGRTVWDAKTAYIMWDMLQGVVYDRAGGLATAAQISGHRVGGKTGTTNDVKDLWFVGTTPQLTGAVWVGIESGKAMPQNSYSGSVAAPIWKAMMQGALRNTSFSRAEVPDGVIRTSRAGFSMVVRGNPPEPVVETTPTPEPVVETTPEPVVPEVTATPEPEAIIEEAQPLTEETLPTPTPAPEQGIVLITLDNRTGYLADADTPAENRQEYQVPENEVYLYQKPQTPETETTPNP